MRNIITVLFDIELFAALSYKTNPNDSNLNLNDKLFPAIKALGLTAIKDGRIDCNVLVDRKALDRGYITRKEFLNGPCMIRIPLSEFIKDLKSQELEKYIPGLKFIGCDTDDDGGILLSRKNLNDMISPRSQSVLVFTPNGSVLGEQAQQLGCNVFYSFREGEINPHDLAVFSHNLSQITDSKEICIGNDIDGTVTRRSETYFTGEIELNFYLINAYIHFESKIRSAALVAISARSDENETLAFLQSILPSFICELESLNLLLNEEARLLSDLLDKKEIALRKKLLHVDKKDHAQLRIIRNELNELKHNMAESKKNLQSAMEDDFKEMSDPYIRTCEKIVSHVRKEHLAKTIMTKFCSAVKIDDDILIIFLNSIDSGKTKLDSIKEILDANPHIKLFAYFEDNSIEYDLIKNGIPEFKKHGKIVIPIYIHKIGDYSSEVLNEIRDLVQKILPIARLHTAGVSKTPFLFESLRLDHPVAAEHKTENRAEGSISFSPLRAGIPTST